ncbi:hypothetical protein TWF718_005279 [Orbilia javanica]|uniref:Uncharacterized protein n=1 Tax=Orbilia javanica TaxID=47235 RepID=A0AAN8RJA2_9PEZI
MYNLATTLFFLLSLLQSLLHHLHPKSLLKILKSFLPGTLHHPSRLSGFNPSEADGTIYPPAMNHPSIYDATQQSRIRASQTPRPPKTRINMANRFIPWDGTLPTTGVHTNDTEKFKHWLHKSSKRVTVESPFNAENADDTEDLPLEYPHAYPEPLRHVVGDFRRVLPHNTAFQKELGNIVIPRHHNSADLLLMVSQTNNLVTPPKGPEALLARFLVCSRTVLYHIPALRGQASHQSSFHDGQTLALPDGITRVFPFFLFKLPQTDLTSLWIILTILHQRFPKAWETMDFPLDLLFNICKTLETLEITGTNTLHLIRERLLYTLNRHAVLQHPPANTPDIATWLAIARTFNIPTNFPALWSSLVITSWRFTPSSRAVDRYLPPPPHPAGSNFKYGNWYWISNLPTDVREVLSQDRERFIGTLLHAWSHFRSSYHLPTQLPGDIETIMSATGDFDGSALDLKGKMLEYSNQVLEYHKHRTLVTYHGRRALDRQIMADVTSFQRSIRNYFSHIPARDVGGNLTTPTPHLESPTPAPSLFPPFKTPPELTRTTFSTPPDPSTATIFTYQSGRHNSQVYWRNTPAPSTLPLLSTNAKILTYTLPAAILLLLITIFSTDIYSLSKSQTLASLDTRFTLLLLFFLPRLTRATVSSLADLEAQADKQAFESNQVDVLAENNNWSVDDRFSARGSLNPKATPARIGLAWKRFTPLEDYPENIYLATRQEMEIKRFRAERAKRWQKEGRDKWGREPGAEGFGKSPEEVRVESERKREVEEEAALEVPEPAGEASRNREGGFGLFD